MFAVILGMLCIIPAIVGLVKFKQVDATLYPFVFSIWLSVVVEVIARWAWFTKNLIVFGFNYNLFMVLNFGLCLYFFVNLKILKKHWILLLIASSIILKLAEYNYSTQWHVLNISSIFECFFIVIFCIKTLTNTILFSKEILLRNTVFIIIVSLLFLNLFDILNTILGWIFPISKALTNTINNIFVVVNAIVYLLYTYAFLCTPTNKK